MSALPIVGTNAVVELTPAGGGSVITVKNSDYSINTKGNVAEGPNTTDGMLRAPGLFDWDGDFKGSVDTTSTSTAIESQLKSNGIYDAKFYRSKVGSTFHSGRIIIMDLKLATGTGTVENYTVSFAKQSGTLTYPDGTTQ